MVMPPRSSSSGMQSIRRELQRRRPKNMAPKSSAANKTSAPSSAGSGCPSTLGSEERLLKPWTPVGVRTRTTKLKTGKVLVLWLRATVVSATHEGYEVFYDDGNFPPGDPNGTVHVPLRHVRMIKHSPSPMTPPPLQTPSSRAPSLSASDATATVKKAPRPTTAGKSLRLVRSLFPELERHARPVFLGY